MGNPHVAGAVRTILEIVGGVDKRRALRLLEALTLLVVYARAPERS